MMKAPSKSSSFRSGHDRALCAPAEVNERAAQRFRPTGRRRLPPDRRHERPSRQQPRARAHCRGPVGAVLRVRNSAYAAGNPRKAAARKRSFIVGRKARRSGFAQPHRLLQHRVEHRREVAGRGVDDLQYLGGRGLLLQGLARLGHQPRVLHRDDRLRGEVLHQLDLLLGERLHFQPVSDDDPKQSIILAKGRRRRACGSFRFAPRPPAVCG